MRYRELFEFDDPQIYCDMDGVLADFHAFTDEIAGAPFTNEHWPLMPEDIFLRLPKMPDADQLWNFIGKFNPFILTAVPKEENDKSQRAGRDKATWMQKNFNVSQDMIRAVNRKGKQHFAMDGIDGRPNVLIDDHGTNIQEFRAKGGIGVHHTSANKTIAELKEMGFK